MAATIPSSHKDLFEKKAFAHLACHLTDGSILVNPVWCTLEGDRVVINSAQGGLKDRAMRRDNKVTVCISDPDDPYRYLELRGTVAEITTDGADEAIDKLAKKYRGVDTYPYHKDGEIRVIYRIQPEKAVGFPS